MLFQGVGSDAGSQKSSDGEQWRERIGALFTYPFICPYVCWAQMHGWFAGFTILLDSLAKYQCRRAEISARIRVRVASLEGVYYRKKELLYILIASYLLQGFDLLINVCGRRWSMLLIPKMLKDATFDYRIRFSTPYHALCQFSFAANNLTRCCSS